MSPARGNDEKHASASERNPCHNCSRRPHLEGRDLSGDEPDTGKQDQQVADLGECDARLMAERKHGSDSSYFDRPIPPVAERDLLNSQDYPSRAVAPRRTGFSGQGVRGEAHPAVSMQQEMGIRFGRTPPRSLPGGAPYDRAWVASRMSAHLSRQNEGRGLGSARKAGMNPVKTTTAPIR